jgi:hypothetical protein
LQVLEQNRLSLRAADPLRNQHDYNPLTGYSGQYALGKLAMVQYAPLPGGTQLYESHSYVGPTGNGAGLPNTKELRLDQTITNANCTLKRQLSQGLSAPNITTTTKAG